MTRYLMSESDFRDIIKTSLIQIFLEMNNKPIHMHIFCENIEALFKKKLTDNERSIILEIAQKENIKLKEINLTDTIYFQNITKPFIHKNISNIVDDNQQLKELNITEIKII